MTSWPSQIILNATALDAIAAHTNYIVLKLKNGLTFNIST